MKLKYKFGFGYYPLIIFDKDKYFLTDAIGEFNDKESVDWLYDKIKLVVEGKWEDKEIFGFAGMAHSVFVYINKTYFYGQEVEPLYEMRTSYLFEIIQEWRDFVYNNV